MTTQPPKIHISKIDAAKRQLETAVNLYFQNADPVSIHTLAGAAHEILHAFCKTQDIESLLKSADMIRKGKEKEYIKKLDEARNFFKHGERDLNKLYQFAPEATEFFIWDACLMYKKITTEEPKLFRIFSFWFYLQHMDIIENAVFKQALSSLKQSFSREDRGSFYQLMSKAHDLSTSQGFPKSG